MKVLVCGGRAFIDRGLLSSVLDRYDIGDLCIIAGGASGADLLAGEWAARRGVCHIAVKANWDRHGKSAGPLRNTWMLQFCEPDLVIAFEGGRGTADMVRQAEAFGVQVIQPTEVAV